jgi:Protein of unknown function (DUF2505)
VPVRFHAEHTIHGTPAQVAGVLSDPDFYQRLELPDLGAPELLAHEDSAGSALIRLRYTFTGSLDPIARRLLGNQQLAWIQEVRIDATKRSGALTFGAERDPKRLHGQATFVLEPVGDDTLRRMDGELVVAVPVIGRTAERRIVPGILRRLDIEAQAVDASIGRS